MVAGCHCQDNSKGIIMAGGLPVVCGSMPLLCHVNSSLYDETFQASHSSGHASALAQFGTSCSFDVVTGNRSGVNESPQPARLGRRLDHGTYLIHSGADHPEAQNCRAADCPGQNRRRRLSCDRGHATDVLPLAPAIRLHAGRGGQPVDPAGEGESPAQKASGGGGAGVSHAQGILLRFKAHLALRRNLLSLERRHRGSLSRRSVAGHPRGRSARSWANTAALSAIGPLWSH